MRLVSVVGMKTSKEQRTTIVSDSELAPTSRLKSFFKTSKSLVIIMSAIALVLSQTYDVKPLSQISQNITKIFTPIGDYISAPFNWANNIKIYFKSKKDLINQNKLLKEQHDRLVREQLNLAHVQKENNTLREALNVQSSLVDDITTIRMSHHIYDGYTTMYYSPYPSFAGVSKDDPIITTTGYLAGRVISTDLDYIKIMPITDVTSRVPVKVEKNNQQGVLAGDGTRLLKLSHVENPAAVQVGDLLVTSGVGGVFPEGLPIARVTDTSETIRCTPLGTISDQDFVLTINHNKPE